MKNKRKNFNLLKDRETRPKDTTSNSIIIWGFMSFLLSIILCICFSYVNFIVSELIFITANISVAMFLYNLTNKNE